MRLIVLATLLVASTAASAAPPPATQREVAQLFSALEHSGCRFNRNGSWYDAAKARDHLQQKYEWLLRHDGVDSAEQFIDRAASKSSMTGRPYLVQCGNAPAVESGAWFRTLLARQRAAH